MTMYIVTLPLAGGTGRGSGRGGQSRSWQCRKYIENETAPSPGANYALDSPEGGSDCSSHQLLKRLNTSLRAAKNQRMNIMSSFISIHRFKIHHMPYNTILI